MDKQLQPGQRVIVNAFGGSRPSVTVVEDRGDVVLICQPDEFDSARAEGRVPAAIGFPREDVIVAGQISKKPTSTESRGGHHRAKAGD